MSETPEAPELPPVYDGEPAPPPPSAGSQDPESTFTEDDRP